MLLGRYGQNNQAGDLAPKKGAQSLLWEEHLATLNVVPRTVQGRFFFHDFIGATIIPNVQDGVTQGASAYNGATPGHLQPTLKSTPVWDDGSGVE